MEERRRLLDRRRLPGVGPGPIPTQLGDVLILHTAKAFTINVVGRVTVDGQQDFYGQTTAQYIDDQHNAKTFAKTLATPGCRVFFRNIDTDKWFEISEGGTQ